MLLASLGLLLFQAVALHAWFSPFTKVEESFNVQAVHDLLLHHSSSLLLPNQSTIESQFDHVQFPGVVPRTFWGAYLLAALVRPVVAAVPVEHHLLVCRLALGALVTLACCRLARAAKSSSVSAWFFLLLLVQFHLPFYASRMLPNTFATVLITCSQADLLLGRRYRAIGLQIACVVIFRCDMLLVLAPSAVYVWCVQSMEERRETDVVRTWLREGFRLFGFGLVCFVASLGMSASLDAHMWLGRHVWPEGAVLLFNTVENKSSQWGTSPWYWYWVVALPKSLLVGYPLVCGRLVVMGMGMERRDRDSVTAVLVPSLVFVALYSLLPHKEARFLFPVLPGLNLCAAECADWLWWQQRQRVRVVVRAVLVLAVLASALVSVMFSAVSSRNYPSGHALDWLLAQKEGGGGGGRVHIDVYSAMSGISRFGEHTSSSSGTEAAWTFSKQEGDIADWTTFDFRIARYDGGEDVDELFELVHVEMGEPKFALDYTTKSFPPVVAIRTQPSVGVWRRRSRKAKVSI